MSALVVRPKLIVGLCSRFSDGCFPKPISFKLFQGIKREYCKRSGAPGVTPGTRGNVPVGSGENIGAGLGRYAAAREEGYFLNKMRDQLKKIRRQLKSQPTESSTPKKD